MTDGLTDPPKFFIEETLFINALFIGWSIIDQLLSTYCNLYIMIIIDVVLSA